MTDVEAWTAKQLTQLGVDSVFAPYVLGMLHMNTPVTEDEEDEKRQEVLDLLMGWLDDTQKIQAENFVDELLLYVKNPHQLALLHEPLTPSSDNDATESDEAQMAQLKATASAFVPYILDGSPEENSNEEFELNMDDEDEFYWSVAYELVEQLLVIFPTMDPERLLDLLKEVDLNVQCAQATMQGIVESEQTKGNAQVCRHYLQGDCRRADCWFLHDTHLIPCRYWIRGGCLQGDECAFAHSFEVAVSQYSALAVEVEDEGNEEEPLEWNFPSLLGDSKTNETITEDSLSLNFKRAVSTRPIYQTSVSSSASSSSYSYNGDKPMKSTMSITQWVETGDQVAAQYQRARGAARDLALARNQCFMNATRAFRTNNKALAKSLSRQGQEYNMEMKQAHFEAATIIFNARNPQYEMDGIVDLHGLHVAEAIELLAWLLPSIKTLDSISLVTGSGHHSHHQRLRPAVERFLTDEGYTFTVVPDRKGYVATMPKWLEEALANALGFGETQDIATFIQSIESKKEIYDAVVQMIGEDKSDIAHGIAKRLIQEREPQTGPKPRPPDANPITNCLECGFIEYNGSLNCASCDALLYYVDERPEAQEARAHRDRLLANDASLSQRTIVHDMSSHFDEDKKLRENQTNQGTTIQIDLVNRTIEAAPLESGQAEMLVHLAHQMELESRKINVKTTKLVQVGHIVDAGDTSDFY